MWDIRGIGLLILFSTLVATFTTKKNTKSEQAFLNFLAAKKPSIKSVHELREDSGKEELLSHAHKRPRGNK